MENEIKVQQSEFKINLAFTITQEMIEDILVGALEGGSNYWYLLKDGCPEPTGAPLAIRISDEIIRNPNYTLPFYDCEDEDNDEPIGHLNQERILKAFEHIFKNHPWHFNNMISGDWDAETADVFLQCAVLGEITYG